MPTPSPISAQPPAANAAPLDQLCAGLNDAQIQAVTAPNTPLLILAGAGTGKTRVLTTRIAHLLLSRQANAHNIMAVTFTNKAAREMENRLRQLLGTDAAARTPIGWLGTFHSLCARILRRHAELVGRTSNFTILDTDDQLRLLKQVLQSANIDEKRWPARHLAILIDGWKNDALAPEKLPAHADMEFANGKARALYADYQQRLRQLNAVDFGDLILLVVQIWQAHTDVLTQYQERIRYILVDEYQDTNTAQYLWLRLLAGKYKQLSCVGDDDQSIYGWRGAQVRNILQFETDFPGAQLVRLEQNYRSSGHILGAASGLIDANRQRLGKTLWTQSQPGDLVRIISCWDSEAEARLISDEIEALHSKAHALNEIAILVRSSAQMRAFEDRFLVCDIPYRVVGGPRFYERLEIRDANAYLRLLVQPNDDLAFERICNRPRRGLGQKSLQTLHSIARAKQCSLWEAAKLGCDSAELPAPARSGLKLFLQQLGRWQALLGSMPHTRLAEQVLDESGYCAMWQADKAADAPGRLDNLKELVRSIDTFQSLPEYLEHIALVMEAEDNSANDKVSLMTLHAAKGLEFDTVFLPGWEDGLFPHQRSLNQGADALEEERRLAYVGLTRARQRAWIVFANNRRLHGGWQAAMPSRFIDELPGAHCEGLEMMRPAPQPPASIAHPSAIASDVEVLAPTTTHSWQSGERAFHIKFGYGTIHSVDGEKLTIDFDKAGQKKVIDSFVQKPQDL